MSAGREITKNEVVFGEGEQKRKLSRADVREEGWRSGEGMCGVAGLWRVERWESE